ncbi:MAG: hypothetical protein N3F07_02535 [Candidatus Micrarchaeota archaeon]|nr:hypothetical protein [Candidatus Micrarchaeota archaeon]
MSEEEEKEGAKTPAPPTRKAVTIRYGDVMVSVEGESSEQAKKDAIEIFSMLEEKYRQSWEKKICTERTRYD